MPASGGSSSRSKPSAAAERCRTWGHWSRAIHFNAPAPLGLVLLPSLHWKAPWRARPWTFGMAAFAVLSMLKRSGVRDTEVKIMPPGASPSNPQTAH